MDIDESAPGQRIVGEEARGTVGADDKYDRLRDELVPDAFGKAGQMGKPEKLIIIPKDGRFLWEIRDAEGFILSFGNEPSLEAVCEVAKDKLTPRGRT